MACKRLAMPWRVKMSDSVAVWLFAIFGVGAFAYAFVADIIARRRK